MSDYHDRRAKEILGKIIYATVATASKAGKPHNSPVRFEYDGNLNIYWFSDKENIHSQNVRENEDVFIVIYDSTVPEGEGEGVYFEAKASEVADPEEINRARRIKRGADFPGDADDFLGSAIRRCYKAVPQRAWMNEAQVEDGKFIRDFRVEIALDVLKSR